MTDARILLVESDPQVRSLLRRFLARSGHEVTEAEDGARAQAALGAEAFEVVILRMNLADGQAPAVMEAARRAPSEPSVVLSGSRTTADRFARVVDCVGAIFLVKPFTARDLAQVMDDALAQHRMVIDSIPAEELDLDSIFDGPVDASLAPGPVDAFASAPPGLGIPPQVLAGGDGLLPPPSVPPPEVLPPPSASQEQSLTGSDFGALGDPAETGDLLAPPVASSPPQDEDTGDLLAGSFDEGPAADDEPPVTAEADAPLDFDADGGFGAAGDFGFDSDAPAPSRTSTQVLIQQGQLFTGDAAGEPGWDPVAAEVEAAQQSPSPVPEVEDQFNLRPMIGDAADDPRGIYGEIGLAGLLVNCDRDMFTGRLVLERGSVRKVLKVAGGRVIDSTSNLRSESLAHHLVSHGHVSERDMRRAQQLTREEPMELSHALVRLSLVSAEEVAEQLEQLTAERILNCFSWVGGAYGVAYDPRLDQQAPLMQLAPLALLVRGVMEVLPVGPMLDHYDRHARRGVKLTERHAEHRRLMARHPALRQLADLCDGRTLTAVVAESEAGMAATLRGLRTLEYLQCVRFTKAADVSSPAVEPPVMAAPDPTPAPVEQAPREEPSTGGFRARRPTGERRIYRHSTGDLRAGPESSPPRRESSTPARAATPAETRRNSRSMRPVRDSSSRRSGVYRSGRRDDARSSGPHAARPRSARPSGSHAAVRRPTTGNVARGTPTSRRPTPPPTRPADVAAMKRNLQAKHAALGQATHYELLEVGTDASADEIRAAYQVLSKQMHQAAAHDKRLASVATEVGRRMAEAASVLSNRRQRAQYDAVHLSSRDVPALERDIEGADRAFDRGRTCLDRGDFPEAFDYFDQASRLAPDVALNRMYRAYAKFRLSYPKHRKAAVEAHDDLKKALLEDSAQDDGFVLMANIYRETGNVEMAVKFYRKALSLNRNNRAAGDGLRVLADSPEEATDGSLFGRLFKR